MPFVTSSIDVAMSALAIQGIFNLKFLKLPKAFCSKGWSDIGLLADTSLE